MTRFIFLAALIVGGCVAPMKLQAQDRGWPYSEFSDAPTVERHHPVRPRYEDRPSLTREAKPKPQRRPEVESYRIVIREDKSERPVCMPALSVVGDQALTEEGAKTQALKAWTQEVRWTAGELYMDEAHAEDLAFRCAHSGVRNVLNRATEAVGISTQSWRCQAIARPCAAPLSRGSDDIR